MSFNIWKYDQWLPPVNIDDRVSIGEGNTPLLLSRNIGNALGLSHLYFKLENLNPTGSYKDRFAAAVVSLMKSSRQKLCIATSSGNTGAALAAYCAAAAIRCVIVVVDGAPAAKLRQMQLYGAEIVMVKGFGKDEEVSKKVFEELNGITKKAGLPLPISAYAFCPDGMQAVQTIAYEIAETIEATHIFSPAGGGGLTLAIARGAGLIAKSMGQKAPAVHCVQPQGNNTIAGALQQGVSAKAIRRSETAISGLQVPNVLDGDAVVAACRTSGGTGFLVADDDVFSLQQRLAKEEGIFCEPAGAVALAGVMNAAKANKLNADDKVVCLITGSGFKDMAAVEKSFQLPPVHTINAEFLTNLIKIHN